MAGLSAVRWQQVNECALRIHGERRRADLQRLVLEELARLIPHHAALFDLCRPAPEGRTEFFDPVAKGISDEALTAYYRSYAAQDYTTWSFNAKAPIVYRDLDIVPAAVRDATPIYREWLEPQGLYYGMGCTVVAEGVLYGTVTLFRRRAAGDFSHEELELLKQVNRHLCLRFLELWPAGFGSGDGDGAASRDAIGPVEALAASAGISGRETQVLDLMLAGRTNPQIAAELYISESTVKKHVNAIYRKLGVRGRVELAALVARAAAH